jgi:hypothetical protein
MYNSWKQGIPTHEFRKQQIRDINIMKQIDQTVNFKKIQNENINKMINSVK